MRSENILQERDRDPVPYRGSTVCTRGKIRCCAGQALGRLGFCGCARPGGGMLRLRSFSMIWLYGEFGPLLP